MMIVSRLLFFFHFGESDPRFHFPIKFSPLSKHHEYPSTSDDSSPAPVAIVPEEPSHKPIGKSERLRLHAKALDNRLHGRFLFYW